MSINQLYPVFIKPAELRILIVGGGEVAEEKVSFISKNTLPSRLLVVAKETTTTLDKLLEELGYAELNRKPFEESDLEGVNIVIVAANDLQLAAEVKKHARARNIWVNVADKAAECDFYLGGIVSRGDLKIAISTNGKAPILARRMREYLENALPSDTELLISQLGEIRAQLEGDFKQKLAELKELTNSLVPEDNAPHRGSWENEKN